MNSDRELLTVAELADRLRLRPRTIQLWARVGRIPVLRPTPKVVRFDWIAVLASLTQGNPGQPRPTCNL